MSDKKKIEYKTVNGVKYFRYTGDEDWQTKVGE